MKNFKKLFVVGGVLLGTICLTANAATNYVNTKKININEIEGNFNYATVIDINNKLYLFDDEENTKELNKNGDKFEAKNTETDITDAMFEKFKDVKITEYAELEGNVLYIEELTYGSNESTEKQITLEGIEEIDETVYLEDVHNGRLIISKFDSEEWDEMQDTIMLYGTDGKLIKSFDKDSLLEKIENPDLEGQTYLDYHFYSNNTDLYIVLYNSQNIYIFDLNGELVLSIKDEDYNSESELLSIFNNNEEKFLYESCTSEFADCTLKMIDKKGNITEVYKSAKSINYDVIDGFFLITERTEDWGYKKSVIYNQDLEVLFEKDNVYLDIESTLRTPEELKSYMNSMYNYAFIKDNVYKQVTNGNYLLSIYTETSGEDGDDTIKYSILSVEDSKLVNISGVLKDKDGKPLKDYTVELHSTVRTVTTDKNGYFKFDNVEEGKHTLTIKDAKGTVLATKEINVINGTETKLDGDTLYFNEADKGLNINLKLDGTNLSIASIDKGVSVPKTFDTLTNSIIVLITLTLSTLFIIKKSNRIKYIKN